MERLRAILMLLLLAIFFCNNAYGASTGLLFPTAYQSISEDTYNDTFWDFPQYITADDGNYAQVSAATFDINNYSYILKIYTFDFSSIPDNATITGVVVLLGDAYYAVNLVNITMCQLLNTSRGRVGTNLCSTPISMTTSPANYTIPSSGTNNLWGNSLTSSWVKDADFGVGIGAQCLNGNNCEIFVDYAKMEVYYTEGGGGGGARRIMVISSTKGMK